MPFQTLSMKQSGVAEFGITRIVDGLYTLRSYTRRPHAISVNYSFYTQQTKYYYKWNWTHFPVNHNRWPSKCPTLTRDAVQYETKHDFSTSPHVTKQHFLATTTVLNTNETIKYNYELILTSADRLLLSNYYFTLSSAGTLTHFPVNHNKWPSKCPTLTKVFDSIYVIVLACSLF